MFGSMNLSFLRWHLGFQSWAYTPLERGFETYFGYLGGGEDYYTHMASGYLDLLDNYQPAFNYTGNYSAGLFANKSVEIIAAHNASEPLFLYLAMQSVHSPIECPAENVTPYAWITNPHRRVMGGMVSVLDQQVGRVVDAMKVHGLWDNHVMVFAADNGGPPYVANSNYPMRCVDAVACSVGRPLTPAAHVFSFFGRARGGKW